MERFVEADWRADLMNIREKQEQTEMELLSPYATQSIRTKGRKKPSFIHFSEVPEIKISML